MEPLTLEETQELVNEYTTHPYYAAAYREMEVPYLPEVCRVLEGLSPCRVLDIGPGYGTMATWLCSRGHHVEVMDRYPLGLFLSPSLRDLLDIPYHEAWIEATALPEQFDRILLTQVLPHLCWRADATLRNIATMLSPGGELLVATVNGDTWVGDAPCYGKAWRQVPCLGDGVPEATCMVKCIYPPEQFRDLLDSVFPNVTMWQPEGNGTMYALCANEAGEDGSE